MKKTFYKSSKVVLLGFLLSTITFNSFAGRVLACDCTNTTPTRIATGASLSQSKRLQTFDVSALNLKNVEAQRSVQQTNIAVSISLADFDAISAVGNTWLLYEADNETFSMNIGTANNTSPQTWALPANFLTYFEGAGRSDFVAASSVPAGLEIEGANKFMRTKYFDSNDRPMDVYDQYFIDNDGIDHLGASYDSEFGEDDTFDDPNYEFSDVPLDLNDSFTSTIEESDYITNLTLTKYIQTVTADAYGTISTPDGTFNCLRMSIVNQKYTRPNEATAYTLVSTVQQVSFMTKEGVYFNAQVSATSGTVVCSNFQYREIVPTASLSETTDVKLNNDSKGVTINSDNDTAHPSAILDIKDNNLGILIPRIAKVNRPASPATGLLIYQIDDNSGFYYFDGSAWKRLESSLPPSAQTSTSLGYRSEGTIPLTERSRGQGIAQLQNGQTFIKFDNSIENPEDLNISLTLEGDCNGLYISKKTKEGFEVKELQKGKSNVKFSYSIQEK